MGLFTDSAQIPSLEGEGAEGGWGDMEFWVHQKTVFVQFEIYFLLASNRQDLVLLGWKPNLIYNTFDQNGQ